jgi:hypothetical protein
MSILSHILSKARSQELEDGIHDNCRILDIDKNVRKTPDDVILKRNTYIKLGKFDPKTSKKTAEKEIAWFNIDPSSEYVLDNFREQIIQLTGILQCHYSKEEVEDQFIIFKGVKGFETAMSDETELDISDIEHALQNKATAQVLLNNAIILFYSMMEGKYGYDSKLLQIKLTFDKSGKYIQQPNYGRFTKAMDDEETKLTLSKTEQKYSTSAKNYAAVGEGVKANDLVNL